MSNIDKDVEKYFDIKKMPLQDIIRLFKREGIENFVIAKREKFENVLKEVEELQDDLKIHEETSFDFQKENIELRKELETQINNTHILQSQLDVANAEKIEWKKIAEFLAEKLTCLPLNENLDSFDEKEELLDWARKEVSKTNFDVEEYIENKIKKAEKQKTVFPMD